MPAYQTQGKSRTLPLQWPRQRGTIAAERHGIVKLRQQRDGRTDRLHRTTCYAYDALGNVTGYRLNGRGLPVEITDALGQKYTLAYDAAGRLTEETLPDGSSTKYVYNKAGQLIRITDTDGLTTCFGYDANGNVTSETNNAGVSNKFTYNAAGLPLTATDSLGQTTRYTYDAAGNRIKETTAEGTTRYTYDAADRLQSTEGARVSAYTWDADGNMTGMEDADSTFEYLYDTESRLIAVREGGSLLMSMLYDGLDERVCMLYPTDPQQAERTNERQEQSWVQADGRTSENKPAADMPKPEATPESAANSTAEAPAANDETIPAAAQGTGTSWHPFWYGFGQGMLNGFAVFNLPATVDLHRWFHEWWMENWIQPGTGSTENPNGTQEEGMPSASAQQNGAQGTGTGAPASSTPSTEAEPLRGIPRLITQSFTEQETYTLTGYDVVYYVNDLNRANSEVLTASTQEAEKAAQAEQASRSAQAGTDDENYIYGVQRLYAEGEESTETYLYDGRGSVVQLLQGGTVSQSYSYNAYGYINADEYGIQAPFYGYNGEQHDPATGLQYLRARYYAPQNGSFTTQDSFAGLLTDALSQNRYAYAQNNPVTFADPSGHSILGSIKNAYNAAKNTVTNAYNTVKSTVTSAYNAAKNTVTSAYNAVKNTVTSAYNAVKNTVTSAYNAVKNTVTGAYNAVKSTVTSAANTVSTAASSAAASVRNVCSSIASSPAANAVFQTLSDPYFALNDATGCMGLTPGVIQDFTESVGAFARHVCDAQMQHYTMQMEAQRAVDQATLNIFGDVMNAVGGWWDRNSSTLMRGISTTLIGISAIGVAAAAAPAATLIGGLAVVVAGGVAILGVTDIVLGSIDLTAAVFDDAEMRAFVNSPGYVTVEGGATLLSMVGSAALQPYVLLSDMMAKAAQANAAEAAQANAAEAARANEAEAAQADATAGNQAGTTGTPGIETKPIDELPDNVQATYNGYDRNGWKGNFSGQSRGTCAGGEYENRNGALPSLDNSGNPITYREFDVNNKIAGFDRDSERFVVGSDGSIYYTDSHYGGGTSPSGLPPFVKIDGG